MAQVEVAFTPLAAHVRTARLVAVAVARRSGVADSLLDEVRLAVGEACSRAVAAHQQYCPAEPVKVALSDTGGRFEVAVTDGIPGTGPDAAGGHENGEGPGGATAAQDSLGLAVIAGLADDVTISRTTAGMSVRMSWPSAPADGRPGAGG